MDASAKKKAYALTHGGGGGEVLGKNRTAMARARVAKTLQLEGDVPPPITPRTELPLNRHLSTRYIPAQVPFSSLSCGEFLTARDVQDLSVIFCRYNVLLNDVETGGSHNCEDLRSLCSLTQNSDGGGGDFGRCESATFSHFGGEVENVASGPGRQQQQHRMTSSSVGPSVNVSERPAHGQRKRLARVGSGTLVDSKLTRDEDDRALSVEWLVELLLDIIASRLDVSLTAAVSAASPGATLRTTHVNSAIAVAGSHPQANTANPMNLATIAAAVANTSTMRRHRDSVSTVAGANSNELASPHRSGATAAGGSGGGGGGGGGFSSRRSSSGSAALLGHSTHFDTNNAVAYRMRRRALRQAQLAKYREELMSWVSTLAQPCNALTTPAVWEECDKQVRLLSEYRNIIKRADTQRTPTSNATASGGASYGIVQLSAAAELRCGGWGPITDKCASPRKRLGSLSTTMGVPTPLSALSSPLHRQTVRGAVTVVVPQQCSMTDPMSLYTSAPSILADQSTSDPAMYRINLEDATNSLLRRFPLTHAPVPTSRRNSFQNNSSGAGASISFPEQGGSNSSGHAFAYQQNNNSGVEDTIVIACYGEHVDGTSCAMWRDILMQPRAWSGELYEYLEDETANGFLGAATSSVAVRGTGRANALAIQRQQQEQQRQNAAARRRREQSKYHIVCWSDLTNNFIVEQEIELYRRGAEAMYSRVPTMTLEEDDRTNNHQKNPSDVPLLSPSDRDEDEDDEEENAADMAHMSANRSRRRHRTRKGKEAVSDPQNSIVADLETFAEELKGLHTQSADHAIVTKSGRNIITSAKDGIVKVWETCWGQFVCNILNVGKAWVLHMCLLHDDQYLMVATTNAELTILEFPKGSIIQKFRGCTTLSTALRKVTQEGTTYVQRYGIKPGECGPHRMDYREGMPAETFHAMRKEAQLAHTMTVLPAKAIEGFVTPTALFFHPEQGLCFFGTAEGVVGCFDISHDVKRSTIMSGANTKPIRLTTSMQAHAPGTAITGILYSRTGNCVISTGPDGSVMRTPLLTDPRVTGKSITFGVPVLLPTFSQKPVRSLVFCRSAKVFVTVHSDRRVLLWALHRTGTEIVHQYPQETQDIVGVTFLEEHDRIALLSADRSIRVYDLRGFRAHTVIYPSRLSENRVEDMASVTLKSSMDDADGALAYLPQSERLVCALRGPVMYEPTAPSEKEKKKPPKPPLLSASPNFHIAKRSRGADDMPPGFTAFQEVMDSDSSDFDDFTGDEEIDGHKRGGGENGSNAAELRAQRRAEQRAAERRRLEEEKLAARRLQLRTTHSRGIIEVVVNRAAAELHSFSADKWKVWSLRSGQLLREVDIPLRVREQLPVFSKTLATSVGWTTDAQTRLLAGARDGVVVTLDSANGGIVHAEELIRETGLKGDLVDRDIALVLHHGNRTYICGGRTCVVRRYMPNVLRSNGEESTVSMAVRLPIRTTITACCIVRDTHVCLGTIDTRLYFYRMVDGSAPYCEEVLRCDTQPDAEPDIGAVVGLFYLNENSQNLLLVILDTGVMHVYAYLKNAFVARFRVVRAHECRVRKVVHHRAEHRIIIGDSIGRVHVLDISKFISEHVEFRRAISLQYSFQADTAEIISLDFFTVMPSTLLPDFDLSSNGQQQPKTGLTLRGVYAAAGGAATVSIVSSGTGMNAPVLGACSPNGIGVGGSGEGGAPPSLISPISGTSGFDGSATNNGAMSRPVGNNGNQQQPRHYLVVGSISGNARLFLLEPQSLYSAPAAATNSLAGNAFDNESITTAAGLLNSMTRRSSLAGTAQSSSGLPTPTKQHTVVVEGNPLSSPQNNASQSQLPVVVGIFGFDTWDLVNGTGFSNMNISPSTTPILRRGNERMLDAILQQAKHQMAAAEKAAAATQSTVSSVTTEKDCTTTTTDARSLRSSPLRPGSSGRQRSGKKQSRRKPKKVQKESTTPIISPRKDGFSLLNEQRVVVNSSSATNAPVGKQHRRGRSFNQSTDNRTASCSSDILMTRASATLNGSSALETSPMTPLKSQQQAAAGSAAAAASATGGPGNGTGPSVVSPHSLESILPPSTSFLQGTFDTNGTFASGTFALSRSPFSPNGTVSPLMDSLGPQRTRKESKYRRNPLLRTYPVAWLKKIGVIHPRKNIPDVDEVGAPLLLPAEVAFADNINDIVLPGEVVDDDDFASFDGDMTSRDKQRSHTLTDESVTMGSPTDQLAIHDTDMATAAGVTIDRRGTSPGSTFFLTGISHEQSQQRPPLSRADSLLTSGPYPVPKFAASSVDNPPLHRSSLAAAPAIAPGHASLPVVMTCAEVCSMVPHELDSTNDASHLTNSQTRLPSMHNSIGAVANGDSIRPPSAASTRPRCSNSGSHLTSRSPSITGPLSSPATPHSTTSKANDPGSGCSSNLHTDSSLIKVQSPVPPPAPPKGASASVGSKLSGSLAPHSPDSVLMSVGSVRHRNSPHHLTHYSPPAAIAGTDDSNTPRLVAAVSWGASTAAGISSDDFLFPGPFPSMDVLEQRRDQLMLARMAKQLDRVKPSGYAEGSFTGQIQQSWVKRAGDAAAIAATRAAALASPSAVSHQANSAAVTVAGGTVASNCNTAANSAAAAATAMLTVAGAGNGGGAGTRHLSLSIPSCSSGPLSRGGGQARRSDAFESLPAVAAAAAAASDTGDDAEALGLDLKLLALPTETDTAHARDGILSARERMSAQLLKLRKQREDESSERRRREELNPNPRNHRYWLPQFSARQHIHPLQVVLPTTLRSDEGAKVQLRQLQQLCAATASATTTTTAGGGRNGERTGASLKNSGDQQQQGPSVKAKGAAYI